MRLSPGLIQLLAGFGDPEGTFFLPHTFFPGIEFWWSTHEEHLPEKAKNAFKWAPGRVLNLSPSIGRIWAK